MEILEKSKSFAEVLEKYYVWNFDELFDKVSYDHIERALSKDYLNDYDLISLLSPKAQKYIEFLARKSYILTRQYFGNVMFLYAPLYVSDHCVNACLYCGFSVLERFKRKTLNYDEVKKEAEVLSSTGIRHVLLLTGESKLVGINYITDVIGILKEYFDEVSIEIYPMDEDDYRKVIYAGAEGLTVYQEVYDKEIYDKLHLFGPKKNYLYRLETPDRGGRAGFREINIGALLGLAPVRREVFFALKHAQYLFETYPDVEVGISFPRMRPIHGSNSFKFSLYEVSDIDIVQFITVARLFLNRISINISTREPSEFRDNIALIGPTRMSAGSSTAVGGYSQGERSGQFDISDERSVEEFSQMLISKGLCPTFVNWIKEI
ncbi:MAG: 2-iminoacetate synthase ThiH [Brevinematia bacterium]